ncbi:MAG: hypothetical protein ACP5E5_03575 [Acidobacteriaceae bacterium]
MEKREEKEAEERRSKQSMAKDVARLYSWANVQDAPYRDFFHLHRRRSKQPLPKSEAAEADQSGGALDKAVAWDTETLGMAARASTNRLPNGISVDHHPATAEPRGTPRLRAAPSAVTSAAEAEKHSH